MHKNNNCHLLKLQKIQINVKLKERKPFFSYYNKKNTYGIACKQFNNLALMTLKINKKNPKFKYSF